MSDDIVDGSGVKSGISGIEQDDEDKFISGLNKIGGSPDGYQRLKSAMDRHTDLSGEAKLTAVLRDLLGVDPPQRVQKRYHVRNATDLLGIAERIVENHLLFRVVVDRGSADDLHVTDERGTLVVTIRPLPPPTSGSPTT